MSLVSVLFACMTGSVSLSWTELFKRFKELCHGQNQSLASSVLDLRLFRALCAL